MHYMVKEAVEAPQKTYLDQLISASMNSSLTAMINKLREFFWGEFETFWIGVKRIRANSATSSRNSFLRFSLSKIDLFSSHVKTLTDIYRHQICLEEKD